MPKVPVKESNDEERVGLPEGALEKLYADDRPTKVGWLMGFHGYKKRDENIKVLGFKSYQTYLLSPLWAIIRSEILNRDKERCRVIKCKREALSVHHASYSMSCLVGRNTGLLFSLCKECHYICEYNEDGSKIAPLDARDKLFRLVTGLLKTKAWSNPDIGKWFREQIKRPENKDTSQKILCRIREEGIYTRVKRFWETEEMSVWVLPPTTDDALATLKDVIKAEYLRFDVITVVANFNGGPALLVNGPGGVNKIWNEAQLIWLQQTFQDGSRRRLAR